MITGSSERKQSEGQGSLCCGIEIESQSREFMKDWPTLEIPLSVENTFESRVDPVHRNLLTHYHFLVSLSGEFVEIRSDDRIKVSGSNC